MTRGVVVTLAGWAAFAGREGCRDASRPAEVNGPPEGAPTTAAPAGPASTADRVPALAEEVRCRAIAVDGDVRWATPTSALGVSVPLATARAAPEPSRVAAQQALPPAGWLDLGDGARLVAKNARTGRESAFAGRASARPCVGRYEEAWLLAGRFESSAGSGESPGAEEWVATPHAVVRYSAAKLVIRVEPSTTTATVAAGTAYVWLPSDVATKAGPSTDGGDSAAEDANEAPWRRLIAGTLGVRVIPPTRGRPEGPDDGATAAVERCTTEARRAGSLARELLDRDAGVRSPALAAEQVRSRRSARAACALAHVRLENLTRAAAADASPALALAASGPSALRERLNAADANWSEIPVP